MSSSTSAKRKPNYSIEIKEKLIYDVISEIIDKIMTLIALIIALPFVLLISIAIKLEDGGPILYSQTRLGKDGHIFIMYKFRSMKIDAEANGAQWAQIEDDRITKIGKLIRKTRLDEIPQLYNILAGHMKLIGPRPERPELAKEFYKELPEFVNRLAVKPGLTGWAQVNGGYDITPAEKLVFDIEYIENRGFLLDLRIILKTIKVVLTGDGAR